MKHALALFGLLMGTWLLLSGHYEPTLIGYGVLCSAGVVALSVRLGILDEEGVPIHLAWRTLRYLPWLFREIVRSNWAVARVILDPRLPIRPRLLQVEASARTVVGQVLYANSITLTPGTITLDVRDGRLLVHALTEGSAAGLLEGEMDRRVAWVEGSAAGAGSEADS
jgi:multicomponent Na+:H+ antiporter subunit E